jgi:hypothetical protein
MSIFTVFVIGKEPLLVVADNKIHAKQLVGRCTGGLVYWVKEGE